MKPAREAAKAICKQRYLEFGCEARLPRGPHARRNGGQVRAGALRQVVN